jgi:MFS family permease
MSKVGMGPFQWKLFWICGIGWLADNMWFNALTVILPSLKLEFHLDGWMSGIATSSTILGAMFGAIMWGFVSDSIGRRPAFMSTLIITTLSGVSAALSSSLILFCISMFFLGTGIGGNLPIDGSLFLEFVPKESQSLLTLMSFFWPVGQVVASAVGLLWIPRYSCETEPCSSEHKRGWRYFLIVLSSFTLLMVLIRVSIAFVESPKYWISKKEPFKAKEIILFLAEQNNVNLEIQECDLEVDVSFQQQYALNEFKLLFKSDVVKTTFFIIFIWVFMALGYTMFNSFLPLFLKQGSNLSQDQVFTNYVIISIFGIPGSFLGMYMSDSCVGRKGSMALSTFGTAVCLCMFTIFTSSTGQLIVSCFTSFLQTAMYGTLYSYTPEVFPTRVRGKAVGLASGLSRLSGALGPLATGYLIKNGISLPLYISSGMICVCGVFILMLPLETRGIAAR